MILYIGLLGKLVSCRKVTGTMKGRPEQGGGEGGIGGEGGEVEG